MSITFPKITSSNLVGQSLELPRDFRGKLNILIVVFKRTHQDLIDEWLPYLRDFTSRNQNIAYYELPTLHFSYLPLRWWIDGGMRAGIADKNMRENTITLYVNKREFKRKLKIPNEETIYIFLVNKDGQVIWQTEGGFSDQKLRNLTRTANENIS